MDTSVYVISDEVLRVYATQPVAPNQIIPESKKDAYWYSQNILYWLTFFNQPVLVNQLVMPAINSAQQFTGGITAFDNPAAFMIQMIMYYLGQQPNNDWNHIVQDVQSRNIQATWTKGQKIKDLVEKARGSLMGRLSKAKFDSFPVGKDVINLEQIERNLIEQQLNMQEMIAFMEEMGVKYQIADPEKVLDKDDIDDWMDATFKQKASQIYADLANGIYTTEGMTKLFPKLYMYAYICSLCGIEHEMLNGRPTSTMILPYYMLIDRRFDDDFGDDDEFRGWVRPFSLHEVFRLRPELLPYKDEILRISNDSSQHGRYNSDRINWYCAQGTNMITAAKVYWKGFKDFGEEVTIDSKTKATILTPIIPPTIDIRNNPYSTNYNPARETIYSVNGQIFKTAEEAEKYSQEVHPNSSLGGKEEMYQAEIWAGKYLIRCKPVENVVTSPLNNAKLEFPLSKYIPNMFLGQSMSEVARLHQLQNQLDMLDFKIWQIIGDAKGKKFFVKSDRFSNSPEEFFQDLATMPVIIDKPTGEAGDDANRERAIEEMDFSLDPMIQALNTIYIEREARMEKIASTSDVGLGQQSYYVGLGSQQQTIAQNNNGVAYLNDMFFEFMVRNLRYSANMMKNYLATHPESEYQAMLGNGEMRFIKMNEESLFDYAMVTLSIEDEVSEAQRTRWSQYLQALAQQPNSGISEIDVFKLDIAEAPRVELAKIEQRVKRNKRDKEKREDDILKQQNDAKLQNTQMMIQAEQIKQEFEMKMLEFKEENENVRTSYKVEMDALIAGVQSAAQALQTHQLYLQQQTATMMEQAHEKELAEQQAEADKQSQASEQAHEQTMQETAPQPNAQVAAA